MFNTDSFFFVLGKFQKYFGFKFISNNLNKGATRILLLVELNVVRYLTVITNTRVK